MASLSPYGGFISGTSSAAVTWNAQECDSKRDIANQFETVFLLRRDHTRPRCGKLIPLLIGLLTRLSALAMIGFVMVQTLVDVTGHGVKLGVLFDNTQTLIDERTLWVFLFAIIALKGAGPLSLDRLLRLS